MWLYWVLGGIFLFTLSNKSPPPLAPPGAVPTIPRSAAKSSIDAASSIYPDHSNPVRSKQDDEIQNLPGLTDPIKFRQFSGYLSADSSNSKFMHYWFVESQSDPVNDPILLWLNGGPGCSSLGGLFTELGPFQVNEDGKTLKLNKYSWNTRANIIFLESPYGVGFSYSNSILKYHTDDTTAKENYMALKSFFKKFPQYKNNSLYLSGESYAGVYLPTLGVLVDADKELNLKGIAIGNGYFDVNKLGDSLAFFNYHHGLVGKSDWDKLSEHCCQGKPPSREACALSGKGQSLRCYIVMNKIKSASSLPGINPYNLYGKCLNVESTINSTKLSRRETIDRSLLKLADEISDSDAPFHIFEPGKQQLGEEPPCLDDHTLKNYLNQPEVRQAIHIPKEVGSWDICSLIVYVVQYPTRPGGLAPQMKKLIESKRNLTLLVYNGDVDSVCNFLGDEWFVDHLDRKVLYDYETWKVDGQVAGFVKHYDGITFATVRGSGHMVPGDKPREALHMITLFLKSPHPNTKL